MTFYALVIPGESRSLHAVARDRVEALKILGDALGREITDDDDGGVAPYLLDEWERGPHWVDATIPIYNSV